MGIKTKYLKPLRLGPCKICWELNLLSDQLRGFILTAGYTKLLGLNQSSLYGIFFVVDSKKKAPVFDFDLIEGGWSLIVGLDPLQHAQINNSDYWLPFKRPTDKFNWQFSTCPTQPNAKNARNNNRA